ncbi:hypothetical protein [Streptomyces griseorubiginosus]|uniref:hypothetical protein n=1 Tax=Streptomyces griseorubiginosus TaxID=67304 RepID=UPI0036A7DA59
MRSIGDPDFGVSWLMSMFHADWTHNGRTAAEAVDYHFWDQLDRDNVLAVRRDALLLSRLPSETIEVLWLAGTANGLSFFDGHRSGVTSGRQWMETITGRCDTWLSRHVGTGELVVPAEWDGVELADAVLSEIEAAAFVPDDVTRALTECTRHCTPDLAFRLLLRAMGEIGTVSRATLLPEHYARLEALGSALHYGEFVVSEVRHLVVSPEPPEGSRPARRFTEFDFGVPWVMAFFHQDWCYEAHTPAELVARHLPDGAGEYALAVRRDARALLDGLPSRTLEVLWDAGTQYGMGWRQTTGAEWTRTVLDVCDTWLATQTQVPPLTEADTEDGLDHRDEVVAEIEAMKFLTAEVRRALVDCAHHCTPDLALRTLLRAIEYAPEASLSEEQYRRLNGLGSALHYGKFVVQNVEYRISDD